MRDPRGPTHAPTGSTPCTCDSTAASAALGGTIIVQSILGAGTSLYVELPLEE